MNLHTANRRARRVQAWKANWQTVTIKSNPFREYTTYRIRHDRRPGVRHKCCRHCNTWMDPIWIEPDGLCPTCH